MNIPKIHRIIFFIFFIFLFSCTAEKKEKKNPEKEQEEIQSVNPGELDRYRPVFHFTPAENWTNDPNGLVQYKGIYHLFYQFNPFGIQWGHMSWGHATSEDLIHWEHQPVAIYEEGKEMIFSGSAVVDKDNTSGLCTGEEGCLVAIYTSHLEGEAQYQSLAYSNDEGKTWKKYEGNPVLDVGLTDFRDPKVFWYEPAAMWKMVVSVPLEYKVLFYQSQDLKNWELTGEFGNQGDVSKIWECPDLVRVPVEDIQQHKWILIISSGSKYGDFTGMQYFVGEYDGQKFIPDQKSDQARWLDYGKDFYAAVTYNNLPEGMNPILLGWVNNWKYANSIPTDPWRGMMSIPRELTLQISGKGYQLIQKPVTSFYEYIISQTKYDYRDHEISRDDQLLSDIHAGSYLLRLEFEVEDAGEFGIDVLSNERNRTRIGYQMNDQSLFINRKESGNVEFSEVFASIESAPLQLENNRLRMDILVDQSVIEVFAADGLRVITDQVFPETGQEGLQLYSLGGKTRLVRLEVYKVR
jgi:fructan beta-fructosidase